MEPGRAPEPISLAPIGIVESPYATPLDAPRQGEFSRAESVLALAPAYAAGLEGLEAGDLLLVLWWAHEADRRTLARPGSAGVFTMRTPHRPNPIAITEVRVVRREGEHGERVVVTGLDAIHGSPLLDLKSARAEFDGWTPLPTRVD